MRETSVLIVGASISGLASAACLQKKGVAYIIIEKGSAIAVPWRHHYERLHLHTPKGLSALPYKRFGGAVPCYPTRQQVVDYLGDYQAAFSIQPVFGTEALSIRREGHHWVTETNNGVFRSKYIIIATGPFGKPRPVSFKGMETYSGKLLHSYGYKTGRDFEGQRVLVVGFGNSACEIAIDLYEQGADPSMAVRSPVNIVPRDLLGIPILRISLLLSRLPVRWADAIAAPLVRLLLGDITRLGLKKKRHGVFETFQKEGNTPVLDIGTLHLIRGGHIRIHDGIDHIEGETVFFADGRKESFDAIIAAVGYDRNYGDILLVGKERFEDLALPVGQQRYFGQDGLYFCGFWVGPTGQIREIALDAKRIARDIAKKPAT